MAVGKVFVLRICGKGNFQEAKAIANNCHLPSQPASQPELNTDTTI